MRIVGCAFAGPEEFSVVEEMKGDFGSLGLSSSELKLMAKSMGAWSKPVTARCFSYPRFHLKLYTNIYLSLNVDPTLT